MNSFLKFSSENNLRELSGSSKTAIKIFQYLGNFFALIFFISPLFQVIKLKLYKENQDIKNLPLFLILCIIFNCLFWLLNAFSSHNLKDWIPLLVSNIGGLVINIILLFFYLFVYLKRNINKFLGFGFFVVDLIIEITYLTFRYIIDKKDDNETFHLIGFVATIINVLMYSSPLQNIKIIIKEGKYEALPIYTLSVGFLVTLSFFIQGIISFCSTDANNEDDKDDRRNATETMVSNGVSFFLLSVLVGIYAYFYFKPPTPQEVSETDINKGNMEEGLNENEKQASD